MSEREPRTQILRSEKLPELSELTISDEERKILGDRIQHARKTAPTRYKQNEVGAILNCSTTHVSDIETGKCLLSLNEIAAFCRLYDKNLDYFLEGILPISVSDNDSKNDADAFVKGKIRLLSDAALKSVNRLCKYFERLTDLEMELRKSRKK